ncbi:MAG: hypothetical protein M1401_18755 [Chloroflexi bacterium]|nr:hypothetical protein [Chloroflexota bacterium]MCL5110861.1 hypothetical protein [Chloroflexota bacterium]
MAKLRVLNSQGDRLVTWEHEKVENGDPEALAAVAEAERIFREQLRRGSAAFKVEAGKPTQRIAEFDPTAEQIVVVPRIAGG